MQEDKFSEFDLNQDKIVTKEEIENMITMRDYNNRDEKADAQREMSWYALFGMITYPLIILISSYFGLDSAAKIIGDMAAVYFGSVAVIIAAFFGAEAYTKAKK